MDKKGFSTAVGDEGGFAPNLAGHAEALQLILQAIETAGYFPGEDVLIGLDCAASEFYKDGKYHLKGESLELSSEQLVDYLSNLADAYPIVSIEDGMAEGDWDGWEKLTQRMGKKIQLVGDDVFVTNTRIFKEGIKTPRFICTLKVARFLDTEGIIPEYNLQYLRYYHYYHMRLLIATRELLIL